MDYKHPYFTLFNGIMDALRLLEEYNFRAARNLLKQTQCRGELLVVAQASDEDEVTEEP